MKKVVWGPAKSTHNVRQESAATSFLAETHQAAQQQDAIFQALEPHLKKALFETLRCGDEILVKRPIIYVTEALVKSRDSAQYQTTTKRIKSGTRLIFKAFLPKLQQIILEDIESGEEYEFYPTPVLAKNAVEMGPNPMWRGLLENTSVYDEVMARVKGE